MQIEKNARPRRLLVISYHFPPDGAVGGQRWAGLSKYLARMGWEVHVVTASPATADQSTAGIHRHVATRRLTLNDRYKAAKERRRAPAGSTTAQSTPAAHAPPGGSGTPWGWAITAARRMVGQTMAFPDYARGWVGEAARTARQVLLEREFDVVVSSGPPHLGHFVAMRATRGLGIPRIIDMRDPWSSAHERNTPHENYFIVRGERILLAGLERVMFARAAKIVINTQEATAALKKRRPDLDIVWFPNGIDLEQTPPRDPETVERGSLAHVGTLYAGRSLSSVFAAMRELLQERPSAAGTIRMHIAGSMDARHREAMTAQLAADGLSEVVKIHGVMPRAAALQLLSRTHVALVLAQNQGMMVPAKLYESVGLGVPTLVIAEEASAASREARRIGAMAVDGGDVAGIRALLTDMLDGRVPQRIDPKMPISYKDLAVQMDRLLREVISG